MTKSVRKFSPVGPCINQGVLVSETAKFFCFTDRFTGRAKKLGKTWANHVEPCVSCRDHAQTQYPNGYED